MKKNDKKNYILWIYQTRWDGSINFYQIINKKPAEKATTTTEMTEVIELAKTSEQLL